MTRKIIPDVVREQKIREVLPSESVLDAVKMMATHRIGALLIIQNGKLQGIFTERDVCTKVVAQGRDPAKTKLADVMTKDVEHIRPDQTAMDALNLMRERNFRHLPVMDGDRILGIVSVRDLYACCQTELEDELHNRDEFIFGVGYGGSN